MAITHNENPLSCLDVCVCRGAWKGLGVYALHMLLHITRCLYILDLFGSYDCVCVFINLQYLVWERSWMSPCWRSLFVLFICMQQSGCWRCWSLQVAGIRRLSNQAAGKLGGSAPNGLLEIIPKLSMNYPSELHHSSQSGLVH